MVWAMFRHERGIYKDWVSKVYTYLTTEYRNLFIPPLSLYPTLPLFHFASHLLVKRARIHTTLLTNI